VVGVLASGAWIARHPPRHRLDSAVRKFKRNPYWSLIAEILEELPKLTEEEKRQL
jgi:hypothetical protein